MIFVICIFLAKSEQYKTTEFERNLHLDLFEGYDSRIRPVKSPYHPVLVNFDVYFAQSVHILEVLYDSRFFYANIFFTPKHFFTPKNFFYAKNIFICKIFFYAKIILTAAYKKSAPVLYSIRQFRGLSQQNR